MEQGHRISLSWRLGLGLHSQRAEQTKAVGGILKQPLPKHPSNRDSATPLGGKTQLISCCAGPGRGGRLPIKGNSAAGTGCGELQPFGTVPGRQSAQHRTLRGNVVRAPWCSAWSRSACFGRGAPGLGPRNPDKQRLSAPSGPVPVQPVSACVGEAGSWLSWASVAWTSSSRDLGAVWPERNLSLGSKKHGAFARLGQGWDSHCLGVGPGYLRQQEAPLFPCASPLPHPSPAALHPRVACILAREGWW